MLDYLDAPIVRLGGRHSPIPHSPPLFEALVPSLDERLGGPARHRRRGGLMLEFVTAADIFGGPRLENDQAAGRAVVRYAALDTPEDVARETADADGIIITTHPLRRRAHRGPRAARAGDRPGRHRARRDRPPGRRAQAGVAVINFPDYATNEVATHAVAMLLALQRRLVEADRLARAPWGEQAWLAAWPARDAHARASSAWAASAGRGASACARWSARSRPTIPPRPPLPDGVNALRPPRRAARVERPRLAAPAAAARRPRS